MAKYVFLEINETSGLADGGGGTGAGGGRLHCPLELGGRAQRLGSVPPIRHSLGGLGLQRKHPVSSDLHGKNIKSQKFVEF